MNRKQRRASNARSQAGTRSTAKTRLLEAAVTAHQAGRLDEAEQIYRNVLTVDPTEAGCVHHLGLIAHQRLDHALAADLIRKALVLRPNYGEAYSNLSIVLAAAGDIGAAVGAAQKAVALQPGNPHAFAALGSLLHKQGRVEDALQAYRTAVRIDPHRAETHFLIGELLRNAGNVLASVDAYRRAIQLDSRLEGAHLSLGEACSALGLHDEALTAFDTTLQTNPDDSEALFAETYLKRQVCEWPAPVPDIPDPDKAGTKPVPPFSIVATGGGLPAQLAWARKWSRDVEAACEARFKPKISSDCKTIRIGYLSGDFHEHATAYLACELFERHDRSRFEVYGYSIGPEDGSPMRRRLEAAFDRFVDLRDVSHLEAARRIFQDEVDILIDLKGYTRGARTQILAHRPAPVQINYLGYPGSMGADFIDYIIADEIVVPPEHEAFYSEKVLRLPGCYQPNSFRPVDEVEQIRRMHGLPENGFVFCCFNNTYKITEDVFRLWMRVLHRVEGSVLWLFDGGDRTRENLRKTAAACGISSDRIVFAPKMPFSAHLARHALADLFLDTAPVNAHTTASDALWTGLPVLTCPGETFASRVAASLNHAVGLPDLVVASPEAYEDCAVFLAQNPDQLAAYKQQLVEQRSTALLFDIKRYVIGLEEVFEGVVQVYRRRQG